MRLSRVREREVPEPPDLALSASVSQAAERRRQHPAESPGGALSPGVPLDAAAIKRTLAEDARTRVLLEGIFADEDDSVEVASLDGTASAHGPPMGDAADLEEYVLAEDTMSHDEAVPADAHAPPARLPSGPSRGRCRVDAAMAELDEHSVLPMQTSTVRSSELLVWGLDDEHSRLAVALTAETRWSRCDIEDLARPIGLGMLNGAIDVINEAAIDGCDEPLLDGYDPLELNVYAADELLKKFSTVEDAVASVFADDWQSAAGHVMGVEASDATRRAW